MLPVVLDRICFVIPSCPFLYFLSFSSTQLFPLECILFLIFLTAMFDVGTSHTSRYSVHVLRGVRASPPSLQLVQLAVDIVDE